MKKNLVLSVLCASVWLSLPAAADSVDKAKPAETTAAAQAQATQDLHKELASIGAWRVWEPMTNELFMPLSATTMTKARLNGLNEFQFSAETQATFKDMFGTPTPLHLTSTTLANGETEVSYLLEPLDYSDPKNGNVTRWGALIGKQTYSRDLRSIRSEATWPTVSQTIGSKLLTVTDIVTNQQTTINAHKIPLGQGLLTATELSVKTPQSQSSDLQLQNLRLTAGFAQRGQFLDLTSEVNIANGNVNGKAFGPVHLAYRVSNLNEAAAARFYVQARTLHSKYPSLAERTQASSDLVKKSLLPVLMPTTRFDLSDFSISYQSLTATLKGAVWLNNAKPAELNNPKLLHEKVLAHFELTVPKVLGLQFVKSAGMWPKTDEVEQDKKANAFVQSLVKQGLIVEKGDKLVSVFDFSNGTAKVNGKVVGAKAKQPKE